MGLGVRGSGSGCGGLCTVTNGTPLKGVVMAIYELDGVGPTVAPSAWVADSAQVMGRVVLVNPDPPTVPEASRQGVLAAVKEAFFRHPQMIEGLARLFAAHLTPEAARRVLVRTLDNSPRDLAVMEEPRNYADYQRGFRTFATGRVAGYVAEQIGLIRWTTPPLQGAGHWRVLLGAHDPLHDPATARAYWSGVLPGARFDMIEDAARFIVFSHPHLVVEALATP